jgi:Insertion element 4 transposase N-terminal/Transposase DDE domain
MRQHGSCLLPADDAGRIMDRLAGLEKVIPPALLRQALDASKKVNERSCSLTHDVMLWVVLAMGLLTNMPIRQVFKHARRMRADEKSPARSSLCEARKRLGVEPVQALFDSVVRPLATPATPGAFYHGMRLTAFDGTTLNAPDSAANCAAFERSNGARGQGAFPLVRKMTLVEVGTHVELALAMGGWQHSEAKLAASLVTKLPSDSLLMMDRGLFGFSLWKLVADAKIQVLARVSSVPILEPIRRLADGSFLAKIYSKSYDRVRDRNGIIVRVIEFTHQDPQRTGCGEKHRLLTTLLDAEKHPALELVCLYHERWEVELVFDEQKTHQDPRRASKPAHLRSETPEGVRQEVLALSLGHFVTRALMFEAAKTTDTDVDRLSFTGCLHILRCRLPECDARTPLTLSQWYAALLSEMSKEDIEPRRNRVNPRVVKQKMSKFKKKRRCHRGIPPLKQTFAEVVVILN